ncbi:serine hydrolase domain-containing protein [Stakelama tenebrarum]|uniref:Beta-lactamase family protein n=1 Tax=Stakelama tenebrarum TaxID=2711215 RepID=A0A6G6YAH3_9SPHN|nr:serine hydrolase domain-containing protein [Sphingosinithalassobacter tenebrarum]QIG81576.1 beta-lactamase family protein [Sphingosinithalassobacter tenebrarum]
MRHRISRRRLLGTGAGIAAVGTFAPAFSAFAASDIASAADAILADAWPTDGPGGAAIVTEHGATTYAGARGLADLATGRPIRPDTLFRLGSITKQFSAALMMQLVDEGNVSLDDPLTKFLPDYPGPGGAATVRQLLNHTSGIKSYTGIPGWMVEANTNRAFTTQQMIAEFADLPLDFEPGTDQRYNNSGYVLVGAVIEAVTGKPWHVALRERILDPLSITDIRYGVSETEFANRALPYTTGNDGFVPAQKIHMSVPHAAGALVGSVGALAKWSHALHHGKVISAQSYALMTSPTELPDGRSIPYGFGLQLNDVRGRKAISHGGGIFGGSTYALYLPETGIFTAAFTNTDTPEVQPTLIAHKLGAVALGDPYPVFTTVAVDPASLEPLTGVYAIAGGEETRTLFLDDGQLYSQREGGSASPVYPAGQDRFHFGPGSLTWFQMRRDANGAHILEMHQNGAEEIERAVRTGPVPETVAAAVPRETLERYVGRYAVMNMVADIALEDNDTLSIQLTGQPSFVLEPKSATEFTIPRVGARIVFPEGEGPAPYLTIFQGGAEIKSERIAE